ncbi:cytochrome C oxidase assembly factor 3b [Pundamilia nyererei]|uniref:Cytochrome c oxidase assembly factor 3 n=1 Tax=Pundamilia nyererei TaxID=303518 RepID=A0A3B4GJQ2_9CICH|nr:PREDICTED: cytochrome c oxidase assembly factor 3 homolog, mitochondrial-like [Pundamilia nyererei]
MSQEGADKPRLTAAEEQLIRHRKNLDFWKKNAAQIRTRNLLTGLSIGAFVVGIFSYTILSVKQERIVEELDEEARIHIIRGPRTGANS